MSIPVKPPISFPLTPDNFASSNDQQTYTGYEHQMAGLNLSGVLLRNNEQSTSIHAPAGSNGMSSVLNVVAENGQERSEILRGIARLNSGRSDPTMMPVDIREINQKMGTLALETQVAMKVEQSGIGALKQLLSGQ